jgi:hypothetical protein
VKRLLAVVMGIGATVLGWTICRAAERADEA